MFKLGESDVAGPNSVGPCHPRPHETIAQRARSAAGAARLFSALSTGAQVGRVVQFIPLSHRACDCIGLASAEGRCSTSESDVDLGAHDDGAVFGQA